MFGFRMPLGLSDGRCGSLESIPNQASSFLIGRHAATCAGFPALLSSASMHLASPLCCSALSSTYRDLIAVCA